MTVGDTWVERLDASGAPLGPGPIVSATDWQRTRRLNAAGEVSFRYAARDPHGAALAMGEQVAGRTITPEGVQDLGSATVRVLRDEYDTTGGLASTVSVEADDLLQELARVTIGDLFLYQDTEGRLPAAVYFHKWGQDDYTSSVEPQVYLAPQALPALHDGNGATTATVTLRPGQRNATAGDPSVVYPPDWLYIGTPNLLRALFFAMVVGMGGQAAGLRVQLFARGAWIEAPLLWDDTQVAGGTLRKSGWVSWDVPDDLQRGEYVNTDLYWVRVTAQRDQGDPNNFAIIQNAQIADLYVIERLPEPDDLGHILATVNAKLPPERQWALDPAYPQATEAGTLMRFANDTALAALIKVLELQGARMRLAPAGRVLQVLGAAWEDAGHRAVRMGAAPAPSPYLYRITRMQRVADATTQRNRLYAYGAGNAEARLDLRYASVVLPEGYQYVAVTIGGVTRYAIEHPGSIAAHGLCEAEQDFPEIGTGPQHNLTEANQLAQAAVAALEEWIWTPLLLELEVAGGSVPLYPGQQLDVEWFEPGAPRLTIQQRMNILEVTESLAQGERAYRLQVSSAGRWRIDDDDLLARRLQQASATTQRPLPIRAQNITQGVAQLP